MGSKREQHHTSFAPGSYANMVVDEKVRDITNNVDIPMTLGHYLRSMDQLTKMFNTSKNSYKDERRQRLYLKDIDCPDAWANSLKESMPESVYYLNDCIESRTGGDGAIREPNEYGQMAYGKGVAPAGDLMSSLPPDMRALNMMCYIGHEGTYTPAHREMCASLGHNIMVEASKAGNGEKAGSSIWFMTETSERELVSEYFLSMLGHDIEVEKHFAQVNAWKKAPFNVWVVEQEVGDLILIPPLAPHQVWNRGTRTVKAAWNRTTVDTLELALHEALPRARMVCRDEQYKNKAIIYYTLANYFELLQRDTIEPKLWKYGRIKQLLDDFKRLFDLYQEVIVSEMFSPKLPDETDVELLPYDSNVTCSYCRCNIFNRFLTCKTCILHGEDGSEDTYDICMDCYAMGRSCACISNMKWVEQWEWSTLVGNYEQWRNIVVQSDGFFDSRRSPQTIDVARKRYGKKPIAEVCQEQLKARPWTDITKPRDATPEMSDEEPEVDDEGRIVKSKKKGDKNRFPPNRRGRVEPRKNKTHACHICCHHDYNWKLAFCSTCPLAYCYGTLFRAFDMMPQTVMEDKEWQCPKCMKMCSCGQCRKNPAQTPYLPKGTLLGHDTRKVADHRSVESLVDFSKTNLKWLQHEENDNLESGRMKRLKDRAEAEKAKLDNIDEDIDYENLNAVDDDSDAHAREMEDIDPELRGGAPSAMPAKTISQYRSPFARPGVNGKESAVNNGNGGVAISDDEADPDSNGLYNNSAGYPSGLLAPVAPMMASEETYPNPSLVGTNRMMGMGYFQQGAGADRILYDVGGSDEGSPRQNASSQNLNLAFSDLLDPALQPEQGMKKRRGNEDEEDVEFFTSKRQKLLAKKTREEGLYRKIRSEKVPPRRSIGKKTYEDLGEDAVPIEDDEGPSVFSHRTNKPAKPREKNPDGTDFDMELAALAISRLSKPKANGKPDKPAVSRRSFRTRQEALAESPLSAPNTIKTPRKSAWLARKEAEDNGESFPAELPAKRSRRSTGGNDGSNPATSAIELSSDSEDHADGGVELGRVSDLDSLFGEPVNKDVNSAKDVDRNTQTAEINQRNDNEDMPQAEITLKPLPKSVSASNLTNSEHEEETPAPKRRGRPPKKQTPAKARSESFSPAPPAKQMMSLKEKLAMKGKSAKIVAKDNSSPGLSGTPNGTVPKSILKDPSVASPASWSTSNPRPNTHFASDSEPSRNVTPNGPSSSRSAPAPVPAPAPSPVRKGPTIVRLLSPSDESDQSSHHQSEESDADDSSSDDEGIPAARTVASHSAIRGGGVSLRGRGRGRPRKSV